MSRCSRPHPELLRKRVAERAEELARQAGDDPVGCLRYWRRAQREVRQAVRLQSRAVRNPVPGCGSVAA